MDSLVFKLLLILSCVARFIAATDSFQKTCNIHMKTMVNHALHNYPKITPGDIQSIDVSSGFRVQRVSDEWYVSKYKKQTRPWRDATMKLSLLGLDIQASALSINIPDGIEFIMDTSDGNNGKGPALAFCYNNATTPSIMIPDNSLLSWPDSGQNLTWQGMFRELSEIGRLPKNDVNKAIFYGNMFDRRKRLTKGASSEYTQIVDTRRRYFEQGKQPNYMPLQSICRHQYLIHLSGQMSYSSRLKYLLLCNSTVIVLDDFKHVDHDGNEVAGSFADESHHIQLQYEEWYYILLKPWVHYIPARNGTELNDVMKKLQADPDLGLRIAENGAKLVQDVLNMHCVQSYWINLLNEYARRMTYRVEGPRKGAELLTNEMILDVTYVQGLKYGEQMSTFQKWKDYFRKSFSSSEGWSIW